MVRTLATSQKVHQNSDSGLGGHSVSDSPSNWATGKLSFKDTISILMKMS